MKRIVLYDSVGKFAENKDIARAIRLNEIQPSLETNEEIILDFKKVEVATQSFIHALISEIIRKHGNDVLDRVAFKSCNSDIQQIVKIVVDYMQDG